MLANDLILHNYAISPYSQKIRAICGYTQLNWYSVITSEAPPRPKLQPLTGGYRKIPVAQIGADIFCDTHTITREIAELKNNPELLPENINEKAVELIQRAEGELFFACGLSATSLKLMAKTLKMFSIAGYIHFMKDRIAMNKDSSVPFAGMKASKKMTIEHLQSIEAQLQQDFLFGDTPNLADFSVYHGLWMIHKLGEKRFMQRFPRTIAWIERIENLGIGSCTYLDAEEALSIAASAEPRPIPGDHQQFDGVGNTVAIAPTDYAKDATTGTLVGNTPHSWILARQHERVGNIHVHFPKDGYEFI